MMVPRVEKLVDHMDGPIQANNIRSDNQVPINTNFCVNYVWPLHRERNIDLFLCNVSVDCVINKQAVEVDINRKDGFHWWPCHHFGYKAGR